MLELTNHEFRQITQVQVGLLREVPNTRSLQGDLQGHSTLRLHQVPTSF